MPFALILLSILLIIGAALSAGLGALATEAMTPTPPPPELLMNVHGQEVRLFGQGLYATESTFMAPIHIGTDWMMLCVTLPLFIGALIFAARGNRRAALLQLGGLAMLTYYALSLGFGVSFNPLFPVYLAMISAGVFALILGLAWQARIGLTAEQIDALPQRALIGFLVLAGLSVMVWLVDLIPAALAGQAPETLGMSTTTHTYLLDIGLIAPSCFAAAWLLWRRRAFGAVLAVVLLVANALIGGVVIAQTLAQRAYGVAVPAQDLAVFVGVFVAMSGIAISLLVIVLRRIPA